MSSSEKIGATPPVGSPKIDFQAQTNTLENEKPSSKIGDKADPEKGLKKLEGKGCTGGAVASALKRGGLGALQGLAGAVGIPLYAAATIIGGGATLAVFVGLGAIGLGAAVIGGGVGAAVGGMLSLGGVGTAKTGAKLGAGIGLIGLGILPAILAESALSLPKVLIINTVGRLGAGLTAFAKTGKTENQQIYRRIIRKEAYKETTNEELYNSLVNTTFKNIFMLDKLYEDFLKPYLAQSK